MSIKDRILDLPVLKGWFEKIKTGEKTHEYRNTANWSKRLGNGKYSRYKYVRFRAGQIANSNDPEKVLYGKILSVTIADGKNSDLKINHDVYDIEFKLIGNKL